MTREYQGLVHLANSPNNFSFITHLIDELDERSSILIEISGGVTVGTADSERN